MEKDVFIIKYKPKEIEKNEIKCSLFKNGVCISFLCTYVKFEDKCKYLTIKKI